MLLVVHDPVVDGRTGTTVREHFRWHSPESLASAYIRDLVECSGGQALYEVVESVDLAEFPPKVDGFAYDGKTYLDAWRRRRFHAPDTIDYPDLVERLELVRRVDTGLIDEVWLFGHPYTGYYESVMAGAGAFWCNGPVVAGTGHARRRFVIMGFSYERGVGEMLEDFGHRAEAILGRLFRAAARDANPWERFTRVEKTHAGRAECGTIHLAPNSRADYDWGNMRPVLSRCDTWRTYPDLSGAPRWVNASEWGGGDIRLHHRWWLEHLPHARGQSDGILHNWWPYVIDPNRLD